MAVTIGGGAVGEPVVVRMNGSAAQWFVLAQFLEGSVVALKLTDRKCGTCGGLIGEGRRGLVVHAFHRNNALEEIRIAMACLPCVVASGDEIEGDVLSLMEGRH